MKSIIHKYFLEECKYMKKKIKTKNYTDNELESEFDIDTNTSTDNDVILILKNKSDINNNKQIFFNTIKPDSIC